LLKDIKRVILKVGKRIYWESGLAAWVAFATLLLLVGGFDGVMGSIQLYAVHLLTAFLCISMVALLFNAKILMFAGLLSTGTVAIYLKSASFEGLKHTTDSGEKGIHLAHVNLSLVTDIGSVYDIVSDTTIDIISFQEFTPDWAALIPTLMDSSFAYRYEDIRMDLYGKAIYSVFPFTVAESENVGSQIATPIITVNTPITKLRLITPYLTPALDRRSRILAQEQLKELKTIMKKDSISTVVMGEFNQVYWSKDILQFRKQADLLNSRLEVSPASLKMPFDHIFYTSKMDCMGFEEINDKGGSHIGCKARFLMHKKGRKNG